MATARQSLYIDARVQCDHCEFEQKVRVSASAGLKVGDPLYDNPHDSSFKRCRKCKRIKLTVVEVQTFSSPSKPQGFWRVPTAETGSSSPTSEGEE